MKKRLKRNIYNAQNPNGLCHLGSILYAMGRLEDAEIRKIPGEYFKEDILISEKNITIIHRIQNTDLKIIKIIEKGTGRKVIIEESPDIYSRQKLI